MSFVYPRVISITRPIADLGVGAVEYGGELPLNEESIATQLPASIQLNKQGAKPGADLPADMSNRTFWKILIPNGAIAFGTIRVRDIVTDDLGLRYAVVANYWNSLGYGLRCELLEN
jgi:hypothetical protein